VSRGVRQNWRALFTLASVSETWGRVNGNAGQRFSPSRTMIATIRGTSLFPGSGTGRSVAISQFCLHRPGTVLVLDLMEPLDWWRAVTGPIKPSISSLEENHRRRPRTLQSAEQATTGRPRGSHHGGDDGRMAQLQSMTAPSLLLPLRPAATTVPVASYPLPETFHSPTGRSIR